MDDSERDVSTLNRGYAEELFERFLLRPESVDEDTQAFFARSSLVSGRARKLVALVRLAGAIRMFGHRSARVNPLADETLPKDVTIDPGSYDLDPAELAALPAHAVGGPAASKASDAARAIEYLRAIYCGSRGYDYAHIHDPEERRWLLDAAEAGRFRPPSDAVDSARVLESLSRVEAFETFVHRMLPGKFRFSIEGLDVLVPVLQEILGEAAEGGVRSLLLGMAHRGRLNVLTHVLHMPYARILSELRDPGSARGVIGDASGFRGDVTYHMGARRQATYTDGETVRVVVTMPPNPSHVEAIDPVVLGMARAAGSDCDHKGAPRLTPGRTLPVLIHGDASFPGQGVVAETLNLGRLPAYHVGGTVHIVANNQIGFTTDPPSLYGTNYASDLAKGFDVPVLHVNADDIEAALEAARTAVAYLKRFQKDFVIDLMGYRRRGHNESDEPSFTQPRMYARIDSHPTVLERYGRELVGRGIVSEDERDSMHEVALEELQAAWNDGSGANDTGSVNDPASQTRTPGGSDGRDGRSTGVSLERLSAMNRALLELPDGFSLHGKLKRARRAKLEAFESTDEPTLDWAATEELAFGSILTDGVAIRFTGEDVERGTFSQRHAVLHDSETGERYVPLQALESAQATFEIENSPLTENAALAFEVGYSLQAPERLVLWEAQYGDFVNGAQTVIDELIVSARTKWGVAPTLCLLLPHGHEGHGPDHSSARPERFLALAADDNLRIASPTMPAQYFHLLRLHATLLGERAPARPLIVFSPKTLLRHPLSRSSVRELAEGRFRPVLNDVPTTAARLLLTSGKLGIDVISAARERESTKVGLARVEELYPFPAEALRETMRGAAQLQEVVWLQEEPRNMGAWAFVRERLTPLLPEGLPLRCLARPPSSSPAEGSSSEHHEQQDELIDRAFDLGYAASEETSDAP